MSNLSELLPAGAGAKSASFVASGTLASGVTVALKTDGTVEAVVENSVAAETTTPTTFTTNTIQFYLDATYDVANDRVVVVYSDGSNSSYGTAVVGTVSSVDNSISFGSPVVFDSVNAQETSIAYDANAQKVVIAYYGWSSPNTGLAIVGTVSGSSISFGSRVTMNPTGPTPNIGIVYAPDQQKVVCSYRDQNNSSYGTAIVGTVSGTSISFGTEVIFNSGTSNQNTIGYDTTKNRVLCAYRDGSNSNYGTIVAGTVSGTSISFGSEYTFVSSYGAPREVIHDSVNNKNVIFYGDGSEHGKAKVATLDESNNSLTFGVEATVKASSIGSSGAGAFNVAAAKIDLIYKDEVDTNKAKLVTGTVSGTTISFTGETTVDTNQTDFFSVVYNTTLKNNFIAYSDETNTQGEAFVNQLAFSETNNTSFVGITDEAISSAASGSVIVQGGVNGKVTGLTIGADYYVQDDGSISSPTVSAPYVIVGATYVQNFSVATQDTGPHGLAFNTDGTKMFVVGKTGDAVYEYALTTGFDVSTASFTDAFSVAAQDTAPEGIAFNTDGTKMFIAGSANTSVYEYALATGFDVSTASFTDSFSVSTQTALPTGVTFNTDGTKMFVVARHTSDAVYEYTLSTGFDISSASFVDSFSVSAQDVNPSAVAFNTNGTAMFVLGATGGAVYEYALTTGFDVSTSSYVQSYSVASQETNPLGLAFNNNGTKMFVVGSTGDAVYEYSTGVGSVTTVPAGRALSTTSMLLEG
jgi:DNA-binding beta-propeller fold protein YncE